MKKLSMILILSVIVCGLLGCESISYTKTDREYYRTHTGEEEKNTTLPKWEYKTERATEKEIVEEEAGIITNCVLRTGVETDAYGSPSNNKKITLPANMEFQIEDMDSGFFKIVHDGNELWIPSKNCLINIKQYIPSLEIDLGLAQTPNYFNIGGSKITGLTEKQLYVREAAVKGEEAWLRVEVAEKLLKAQQLFLKDGYSIKVVDAYRPKTVTDEIRDGLNGFLQTSEGQALKNQYFGGYGVGAFLAQGTSAHNYGVAIDMTLLDKETGKEISMPSKIHTLDASSAYDSWKSGANEETSHGEYMRGRMVDCGFSTLDSEWWHFQVDSIERVLFDIGN
ncbi:MAG: M15 family metallopeptidase [Lachnospiraceae bacterium]